MSDQTPMDPARAALESLYYDQATELCDLVPLAEEGDDRMHLVHLAIMEALADAHEEGRREERASHTTVFGDLTPTVPYNGCEDCHGTTVAVGERWACLDCGRHGGVAAESTG